jgi:poly(A) polymerase
MIKLKQLISEEDKKPNRFDLAIEYLKQLIAGTEFEGKVYIAGGAVRDELMGKPIKDIDLVVDIPEGGIKFANWATEKMGNHKPESNPVIYPKYGTAKFNLRGVNYKGEDLSAIDIETVAPRTEEYEPGSRKPKVKGASLKADAMRRDLTANSLFKSISTGEIIDLTGKGREDLEKGVARTPVDPDVTFKDDPLRMLRLIRFYVKYNWTIPLDIVRSLKRNAGEIKNISMERVQEEFDKIFKTNGVGKAFKLIYQSGLAKSIFPEIKFTTEKLKMMQKAKTVQSRMALLFHDMGKKQIEAILSRLEYPNRVTYSISHAVALQKFFDEDESIKRIRQFRRVIAEKVRSSEISKLVIDLTLELIDELDKPVDIDTIKSKLSAISHTPAAPPIDGHDIMALGIPQGKLVNTVKSKIQDKFEEDPNTPREDYIKIIKSFL